ncbi:MAG: nucleotidyl transferase AbiEii/AbiGii toxin family protein [Tannerella sp.]|jgi:predicted nucleotidyltransferase component of viral defense system|nr:nucleotidyl transferase AbiEii/AbiGii toxin family protein [Tannerella sp.]
MKKGNAKSIRAVLKNIADHEGLDLQSILTRYFHERLLYRIFNSAYLNRFFLKGGALLFAFEGLHARPTNDIDMLATQISNDREIIKQIFRTICNIKYDDDCVFFNADSIETMNITEDDKYVGVRIFIATRLDTVKQRLQIDIGFSDIISPAPVRLTYPVLLNEFEYPVIQAYSIETVIAEKFEIMIARSTLNSRMKDFYDVYILLKNHNINDETLTIAIRQTFKHRNTGFVDNHSLFSESFYRDINRQILWKAFLRKIKHSGELEFSTVMICIVERLYPIYRNL